MASETSQPGPLVTTSRVAIIGGGFAALMLYAVLRFRGMRPEEIRIYADEDAPEKMWERTIRSFRLTHMRSESLGHFYPTDSPGLATVDAWQRRSIIPLVLSWFDAYHPTVDFFLAHTRRIAAQIGYRQALVPARIGRVAKDGDHFMLYNQAGVLVGVSTHVIFAIGHSRVTLPQPIEIYREKYGRDNYVVHSFEDKDYYPARRVLVIGDGLTGGTECANALAAGSQVYVLTRYGHFLTQALNSPRPFFSRRGLRPYRSLPLSARLEVLRAATQGTIKPYHMWMKLFKTAEATGQLQYVMGRLLTIERMGDRSLHAIIRLPGDSALASAGHALRTLVVDQVIVATGFSPASTTPLLAQLITDYQLTMAGPYIQLEDNFRIRELSTNQSWAAVIGQAAGWALPAADSLGGMKIIAHDLADQLMGNEGWHPGQLLHKSAQWLTLMTGKELA